MHLFLISCLILRYRIRDSQCCPEAVSLGSRPPQTLAADAEIGVLKMQLHEAHTRILQALHTNGYTGDLYS